MLKQPKPAHHLQILFPPVSKEKKNEPKTEYSIANKINKPKHRYQK